ncbi:ATP-binding protein [Paenibacillus sp. MBLB4367]|uniref:ATP-binding protein n=1 Tax=Paenibacillus sp. MBLB4367 TaxID=3384767 RepID=UPI003907F850
MSKDTYLEEVDKGTIVLKGNRINAVYKEAAIAAYRHNPYIEALPPILEWEDVSIRIDRMPAYEESERLLPPNDRLQLVQTIDNFVLPLPSHLDLEKRFSRMIRHGYMARNPIDKEWKKQMRSAFKNLYWNEDENYVPLIRSTAAGFAVLGCSGLGKSTAIESVLGLYPQVIQHTSYNGETFIQSQLVWLKIDCPKDGSLRSMCLNFFQSLDKILGTKYRARYKREATNVLIDTMENVASIYGIGVLVIDEIQNLNEAKRNDVQVIINALVKLINTIGVPVVLVGTYRAHQLLSKDFATARRSSGQGDVIWTNMSNDEEWGFFINKLWEYQWTNVVTPLTPKISQVMYDESQGIIDIAVKLYKLAQWRVIGEENEKITASLIRQVAKDSLRLAKPMLDALRQNDDAKLARYSDMVIDIDSYLRDANERVSILGSKNTLINQYKTLKSQEDMKNSPFNRIKNWLMEAGVALNIASESAQKAAELHASDNDLTKAMHYALEMSSNLKVQIESTEDSPKKKKQQKSLLSQEEMEALIDDQKRDLHEII